MSLPITLPHGMRRLKERKRRSFTIVGALHCEYRAYHSKEKRVPFTIDKREIDIQRIDLMRHGAKAEETKGIGQASGLP